MKRFVLATGAAAMALAASADLYWYGNLGTAWDTTTKNWRTVGTDAEAAYADGDNVLIDTTKFASGASTTIQVSGALKPGAIVFDVAEGKTVENTFASKSYYDEGTQSFAKRGKGTLKLNANGSGNTVHFHSGTADVYEGTLQVVGANKVNAVGCSLDNPTQWTIHEGATFQAGSRNCLGNNNNGSSVKLHVKGTYQVGPELESSDSAVNNLCRELWLDGGSVVIMHKGNSDAGSISVQDLLKVTGTKAQKLESNGYSNTGISFGWGEKFQDHPRCVIDVADTGNGETPDLDIALTLGRGASGYATSMMGFVKKGAGVMRVSSAGSSDSDRHVFNGDMDVLEGEVQFTGAHALVSSWTNRILVSTNAVFTLGNARGGCTCNHTVDGHAQNRIVVDHGTLVLDAIVNAEDKTDATKGGYMYLGKEITFDDGVFEQRVIGMGGGARSIALLNAGELFHVKGTKAFDFTPPNLAKQRMTLNVPQTEFRIEKTVADGSAADMVCGYQLDDWYYHIAGSLQPSGFLKTGAGTLVLTNAASRFSGNVEIREGCVELNTAGFTSSLFGKAANGSFLGCHTNANTEVLVTTNGTLRFMERSMFDIYTYGYDGGNNTKQLLHLNGGKIELSGSASKTCAQHFGPMRVENGATIDYSSIVSGTTFDFHGEFRVSGNQAFTLPAAPTDGGCLIQLYPDYQCTFNVEDVTGDLESDFITYLAPGQPQDASYYDGATTARGKDAKDGHWWYGFVKKGEGTMSLMKAHASKRFDLPAIVSNGTMLVNADFSKSAAFHLCPGTRIGGSGKVSALEMENGAGFQADASAGPLTVTDASVTLPASGEIVLKLPAGTVDPEKFSRLSVLHAERGLVGGANVANWTVTAPGHPELDGKIRLSANGQDIRVGRNTGLMLIFR